HGGGRGGGDAPGDAGGDGAGDRGRGPPRGEGGGRERPGQDGPVRGRPQLGADRLGGRLRGGGLRGEGPLALGGRGAALSRRYAAAVRRGGVVRVPQGQPRAPPASGLHARRRFVHLLDL